MIIKDCDSGVARTPPLAHHMDTAERSDHLPHPHHMIRSTLAALALLLTLPAQAGSFYPNLYGVRYCELRRAGIERQEAIKVAMAENWSSSRQSVKVTIQGQQVSTDSLTAALYIQNNCPEFLK